MRTSLQGLSTYFGEEWDVRDPSRLLAVVRDFLPPYERAVTVGPVHVYHHHRSWCSFLNNVTDQGMLAQLVGLVAVDLELLFCWPV